VFVVKAGPKPEVLATNALGDASLASPAVSKGVLYFRTQGHLIAVGNEGAGAKEAGAAR
jgi:hypothetical protein